MEKKFARGKNFTFEDKSLLLSLVESKRSIVENKVTNKVTSEEKKEAWSEISSIFNASSTVARTAEQLKVLYDNMKRRSKKEVASQNKDRYNELLDNNFVDMEDLRQRARQDKKEISQTGGGTFMSSLDDNDLRILALLGDNAKPLSNPFDDASMYFADPLPEPELPVIPITPTQTSEEPPLIQPTNIHEPSCSKIKTPPPKKNRKKRFRKMSYRERYYAYKLGTAKIERKIMLLRWKKELSSSN